MAKKRKCQHQCQSATKRGLQCKNKVELNTTGNHLVIRFQGTWAELCHVHFNKVFNWLIAQSPVATNEAFCETTVESPVV